MISAGDNDPVAVAKAVYQAYVDMDRAPMGRSNVGIRGDEKRGS